MLRRGLYRSIVAVLGPDTVVRGAAVLSKSTWKRSMASWVVAIGAYLIGVSAGLRVNITIVALMLVVIGIVATPSRRIVADTSDGLYLLTCSRFRSRAKGVEKVLDADTEIERRGMNVIMNTWVIDGEYYEARQVDNGRLRAIVDIREKPTPRPGSES